MDESLLPLIAMMAAAGVVAGFLAGLLGIGGGIVTVPVLYLVFGALHAPPEFRMHLTIATSLTIIIPTAIMSTASHAARDAVSGRLVVHWGPWIFLGAICGTMIASFLDTRALVLFFAVMAFLMGLKLLLPFEDRSIGSRPPRGPLGAAISFTIGTFSTLMGIGGATFSVPVMTLYRMPIHRAVGTAAALGLFISVPAAAGYVIAGWGREGMPMLSFGFVNLIGVGVIAPLSMGLAPLGARVAHAISKRRLSILFGLFLIIAAARMGLGLT